MSITGLLSDSELKEKREKIQAASSVWLDPLNHQFSQDDEIVLDYSFPDKPIWLQQTLSITLVEWDDHVELENLLDLMAYEVLEHDGADCEVCERERSNTL